MSFFCEKIYKKGVDKKILHIKQPVFFQLQKLFWVVNVLISSYYKCTSIYVKKVEY